MSFNPPIPYGYGSDTTTSGGCCCGAKKGYGYPILGYNPYGYAYSPPLTPCLCNGRLLPTTLFATVRTPGWDYMDGKIITLRWYGLLNMWLGGDPDIGPWGCNCLFPQPACPRCTFSVNLCCPPDGDCHNFGMNNVIDPTFHCSPFALCPIRPTLCACDPLVLVFQFPFNGCTCGGFVEPRFQCGNWQDANNCMPQNQSSQCFFRTIDGCFGQQCSNVWTITVTEP